MKIDQLPPHSIEFEQSILAGCLFDKESLDEYASSLKPADFYQQRNQVIFAAMLDLANKNCPVKAETVAERLLQLGKLEQAGG